MPVFDPLGHDWVRVYNTDGEPLMAMVCGHCGYIWHPDKTLQQIGRCAAGSPKAGNA